MKENNWIKKIADGFKSVIAETFTHSDTRINIINEIGLTLNCLYVCFLGVCNMEIVSMLIKIFLAIIFVVFFNQASIVCGLALIVNAVIMAILENIGIGTWLTLALGVALVAIGVFRKKIVSITPKAVVSVVLAFFWIGVSLFSVLYGIGSDDSVHYHEDALIVLGCGVKGDEPGTNLTERLDRAIEYHKKNPDAIIVVSGGKGDDENVSEAYAMEQYLIRHGVPAELIIKEDRATSTEENFLYSKEILNEYFDGDYTVAFITNDFHIYRSSTFAKLIGFTNATHAHSNTTWYTVVPNGLRECITVLKLWILDQWKY